MWEIWSFQTEYSLNGKRRVISTKNTVALHTLAYGVLEISLFSYRSCEDLQLHAFRLQGMYKRGLQWEIGWDHSVLWCSFLLLACGLLVLCRHGCGFNPTQCCILLLIFLIILLMRATRCKCIVVNPSGTNENALGRTFPVLQLFCYLCSSYYLTVGDVQPRAIAQS